MAQQHRIRFKLWVQGKGDIFLGNGRVALLKAIAEQGSISKAARSMKMSYRKAWEQIDAMNKEAKAPLVIRNTGGKDGGGTAVTEEGLQVIVQFEQINERCRQFLEKEAANYNFD